MNRCSGNGTTPFEAAWSLYERLGLVEPPEAADIPWGEYDRALAETYGWTPHQIDSLTLPEYFTFLPIQDRGKNDPRTPQWVKLYKTLSPAQILMLGFIEQGRTK